MAARILQLNLMREFFDSIAHGEKREEYRERKAYWKTRLEGREYDIIRFRNGYGTDAPEMDVEWRGVKQGHAKRGANVRHPAWKGVEREAAQAEEMNATMEPMRIIGRFGFRASRW